MDSASGYELIDFGNGRRLDSLAGYLVDRPCPAAEPASPAQPPARWRAADATYDGASRGWTFRTPWPADLRIRCGDFWLPFQAKPFGHIGCFPEQQSNWQWIREFLHRAAEHGAAADCSAESAGQLEGLNLFAHTGGSTLAMVDGGARATHVDAAKPSVLAARAIAAAQPPAEQRIRFLVEDAARYVAREVRRGRRYTVVSLDPPSYGHGNSQGRSWRIERDLWPLLDDCLSLLGGSATALLVTGHSVWPDEQAIANHLQETRPVDAAGNRLRITSGRSQLLDQAGRRLDAGYFVRATW